MATKPSSVYTFATDLNFSSGPAIGQPVKVAPVGATQGFVPGDGIEAESPNYMLNINGQWVTDWLVLGSSAAGEDAHLVETNSNGRIAVAKALLGGHTTDGGPSVTISPPVGGGVTLDITGDAGINFAVGVSNGGSGAGLRSVHTGTGIAIQGLAIGTDNDAIEGTGTGTGRGVVGVGGGTGDGVAGTGGVTSGAGVRGTAGSVVGTGVLGIGGAGASSIGVDGQAGASGPATGVRGLSDASASTLGTGVLGQAQGSGVGVRATATDGYGLLVFSDVLSPVSASTRFEPQDTEPSGAHAEGDFYTNLTNNLAWYRDDGGFKALHVSLGGHDHGFDSRAGTNHDDNDEHGGPSFYAVAQVVNKVTADIKVRVEISLGGTAASTTITVRIRRGNDETGTIIATRLLTLTTTTASPQSRICSITIVDAAIAAGTHDYQVTVERTSGAVIYYTGLNSVEAEIVS